MAGARDADGREDAEDIGLAAVWSARERLQALPSAQPGRVRGGVCASRDHAFPPGRKRPSPDALYEPGASDAGEIDRLVHLAPPADEMAPLERRAVRPPEHEDLRGAVGALSPKIWQVLDLHYCRRPGSSWRSLERLNLPLETVKKRHQRAVRNLRERLIGGGLDPDRENSLDETSPFSPAGRFIIHQTPVRPAQYRGVNSGLALPPGAVSGDERRPRIQEENRYRFGIRDESAPLMPLPLLLATACLADAGHDRPSSTAMTQGQGNLGLQHGRDRRGLGIYGDVHYTEVTGGGNRT